MPSHASHTRRRWRFLALVAAMLACGLAPSGANATETGVVPDISPAPVEPATEPEGEVVSSSIVRRSAMLTIRSARVRRGRLAIAGRLALGTTGRIRGVARYRGGKSRFAARVDLSGRISIHKRLPGGKDARTARVTLVYGGSWRFQRQRVTLKAARRTARLRIREPNVHASGTRSEVRGSVVRRARGSVILRVNYRIDDGRDHVTTSARIRHGRFRRALELPADAQDAVVRAVFRGDGPRGVAGQSVVARLGS